MTKVQQRIRRIIPSLESALCTLGAQSRQRDRANHPECYVPLRFRAAQRLPHTFYLLF
jgi:hypothetical protein